MIKQYNYDKFAKYYDILELGESNNYEDINHFLDLIFKQHKVKTILDMTCGTGAQAIGLTKRGYTVTASDLSQSMLQIAKEKAKGLNINFVKGDIRSSKFGKFDAVISIFNAIGHLSKPDFIKALRNIQNNLNKNGLYIFDIFNLDFMKSGGFINYEFLDKSITYNGTKFVRFNKNNINYKTGVISIKQKTYIQEELKQSSILNENWEMQIYSLAELKQILKKNGFKIMDVSEGPKTKFMHQKSLSVYLITQKAISTQNP